MSVGYRISQDQNSLLSYSYDGPVMTVDPVSTGSTGWKPYLEAYNQFCSDRGGLPLFNQTYGLTRAMAKKRSEAASQELGRHPQDLRSRRPSLERLFPHPARA